MSALSGLDPAALESRIAALEAAPRLAIVYQVSVTDMTYDGMVETRTISTHWREADAVKMAGEQKPRYEAWPKERPIVVGQLVLVVGDVVQRVMLGEVVEVEPGQ